MPVGVSVGVSLALQILRTLTGSLSAQLFAAVTVHSYS